MRKSKYLQLALFLLGSLAAMSQERGIEKMGGIILDTLTTAEINALPPAAKVKGAVYFDRNKGNLVVSNGSTFDDVGSNNAYTAGTGLDLSGSEFNVVDAELNPSWDNVTGKPTNWIIKGVNTITSEFTVGESNGPSFSLNTITNEFRAYGGQDGLDQVRHTIAGGIASYNFESTGFGVNDYIFDLTYNSPNDVARKVDVDAAISGISSSGINVLANGQVSLTNLTGPHAVTTVTHGIGVPPLPQNINVTLYRSNQQTNTGVQVAIGNITSTTFDIITSTTGTDDLVASWVVYSGGGGGTPATEGHTVQDNGTPVAQQPNLNFTGPGVTVTNDGLNNRTTIDISGGGGTDDQTSTEVPHTPSGDIAANNVGDAIVELDNEKLRVGTNQSTQYIQIGDNLSGSIKIGSPANSVVIEGGDQADGDLVQLTVKDNSVDITGLTNAEIDAGIPAMVVTKSWILEKIARFYNANNTVRTYYTTENVTMTLSNKEIQSGTDIGSPVVNTISGATTATANLVDVDPAKIDVFRFDVLHSGGQWDITSTNGFVADGFTGDTVRVDGIGSVDFFETGVNTGIFYAVIGTNGSFVTTGSLIDPVADDGNLQFYFTGEEFDGVTDATSQASWTDQTGNLSNATMTNVVNNVNATHDEIEASTAAAVVNFGNVGNLSTGTAETLMVWVGSGQLDGGAIWAKRDDSSGGSNDHYALYNGYYYVGGTEGTPSPTGTDAGDFFWLVKQSSGAWEIIRNSTVIASNGAYTEETSTAALTLFAQVNGGGYNDHANSGSSIRVFCKWSVAKDGTARTAIMNSLQGI